MKKYFLLFVKITTLQTAINLGASKLLLLFSINVISVDKLGNQIKPFKFSFGSFYFQFGHCNYKFVIKNIFFFEYPRHLLI
jgi:hypothetical protein